MLILEQSSKNRVAVSMAYTEIIQDLKHALP